MTIPYRKVTGENGISTLTVDVGLGDFKTIASTHPHFEQIVAGLDDDDRSVFELIDVGAGITRRFRQITDRISYDGSNILFDGDVIHSVLAEQLQRALESGEQNYEAIAKFWEKLEGNPNEHSRTQSYDWLVAHSFQITPEGDIVGFKGVHNGQGGFVSGNRSQATGKPSAFVDGVAVPPLSTVPNNIGTVVSMPRSEVAHDPSEACARGLHVSTRSYAADYGNVIIEVHVNPRDIVSVPTDGGGEKVRVCKYKVARVAVSEHEMGKTPVLANASNTWVGDVGYRV